MKPRAVVLVVGCLACGRSEPPAQAKVEPAKARVEATAPGSPEAAFVAELLPFSDPGVAVIYDLEGTAGARGELELWLRPGGLRRQRWIVEAPTPAGSDRRSGVLLATPDGAASWTEGVAGPKTGSPLGVLARAFAELPPERRERILEVLRTHRVALAAARESVPATEETIAGQRCVVQEIAAQKVCLWEEARVPLSYDGSSIKLVARSIERGREFPDDAFALPEGPPGEPPTLDTAEALESLEKGQLSEVAWLWLPGLGAPAGE